MTAEEFVQSLIDKLNMEIAPGRMEAADALKFVEDVKEGLTTELDGIRDGLRDDLRNAESADVLDDILAEHAENESDELRKAGTGADGG